MTLGALLPLVVTPFKDNGDLDLPGLQRLLTYLRDHGADGAVVLGTTGEFFTLSAAERVAVIDAAVESQTPRFRVGIGCGDTSTRGSCYIAEQAARAGAGFTLVLPSFYLGTTDRHVREHLRSVVRAAALPALVYDGGGGVVIDPDTLGALHAELPSIVGVKVAVPDPAKIASIAALGSDLRIYCGEDYQIFPGMSTGAHGVCVAGASVQVSEFSAILRLLAGGDTASALSIFYSRVLPFWHLTGLYKADFVAAFKQVLYWKGLISSPTVRQPCLPLLPERAASMKLAMTKLELL